MALDFPSNPVNGEVFGSYVWDSVRGVWKSREESATVAITSPTAPVSASPGDIWINTSDGTSFVYYNDGSSSQWIEILASSVLDVPTINSIDDISDVNVTGATDGNGLVFDTATNTWVANKDTDAIKMNIQTISANYTIPAGYNGMSAGPITIASGVVVTIPAGSSWSIV